MKVCVVIPCYRARDAVCAVLARIGAEVHSIWVVDDACPEGTGAHVEATCNDPRVTVVYNPMNLGVGGAMARGYRAALDAGADVVVKIDADGQMDPAHLTRLIQPIVAGEADYTKGNRFAAYSRLRHRTSRDMPPVRWFGNSVLSFGHKVMSGYWNIVDPTNGYTAIHRYALEGLDLGALSPGYFFENDMLFQLNLINAVVRDVPLPANYGTEATSLSVRRVLLGFPPRMVHRTLKRIGCKYFLYDFNVASLELLIGGVLVLSGTTFGAIRWVLGVTQGQVNTPGTVMLAALPIILGFQLLLAAVSYDITNVPRTPLTRTRDGR